MLNPEALNINEEYRFFYSELNLFDIIVRLSEIEQSLYKFEKVSPLISEKEIIVVDITDYGLKWACEYIEY